MLFAYFMMSPLLKFNFGCSCGGLVGFVVGLLVKAENHGNKVGWKAAYSHVVGLCGGVELLAGYRNAVLCPLELRLQLQKVLVGL